MTLTSSFMTTSLQKNPTYFPYGAQFFRYSVHTPTSLLFIISICFAGSATWWFRSTLCQYRLHLQ